MARLYGSGTFGSGKYSASTSYSVTAAQGAFTLSGQSASPLVRFVLACASGAYAVAGQVASPIVAYVLASAAGALSLFFRSADFLISKIWTVEADGQNAWASQSAQTTTWTPARKAATNWSKD